MPALVNIKVGSLRGTSGDDGTISWPLSAKNLRNVDLISLTPLILVQSQQCPGLAANGPTLRRDAFRQGYQRCPETVQANQGLAAPAQVRPGTKPCDECCGCVDSPGAPVFSSYLSLAVRLRHSHPASASTFCECLNRRTTSKYRILVKFRI